MRAFALLGLLLTICLIMLAACNKGQQQDAAATTGQAGISADTPAAAADGSATDSATAEVAQKAAERKRTPPDPQIGGTWFALFGRHESGVVESAWENGHRVRFVQDGLAIWIRVENGWDVAAMESKYEVSGSTIKLTYTPARAVEFGLSQLAPLGLARDEEIGLLSKTPGRDSEIGLTDKAAGEKAGDAEKVEQLQFVHDGDLLVLTDNKSHVMVYARVPEAEAPPVPAVAGEWLGDISGVSGIPATATLSGDTLALSIDGGKGQYTGKFVQGYFTGKFKQGAQLSLAALQLGPDGKLNGLLLPDPYSKPDSAFDFTRTAGAP